MNSNPKVSTEKADDLVTELLILPDGRILVHNLTRSMASVLSELNPDDESIQPRAVPPLT